MTFDYFVMQSQTNSLANSMSSDSEGLMIVQEGSMKRQYLEMDSKSEKKKAREERVAKALEDAVKAKEERVSKALEDAVVTQYL